MKAITTIKNPGMGTLTILSSENDLIATASKIKKGENMHGKFEYRIAIYGGVAHGKFAYAIDFGDLNEKSVEISKLPR